MVTGRRGEFRLGRRCRRGQRGARTSQRPHCRSPPVGCRIPPPVTATITGDDGGYAWKAGDIAVPDTAERINPNERVAVELADGRVMLNVRNEWKARRRVVATGWCKPAFEPALTEPICMGSIIRL